jgi:hypothetical protein
MSKYEYYKIGCQQWKLPSVTSGLRTTFLKPRLHIHKNTYDITELRRDETFNIGDTALMLSILREYGTAT